MEPVDSCCFISCHNSHIKGRTHSPWHNATPKIPTDAMPRLWSAFSSLVRRLSSETSVGIFFFFFFVVVVFFSLFFFGASSVLFCFAHTASHLSLTLSSPPLLALLWLFFPLCSSLQWGEKHTCQIRVGHRVDSHPQQLLRSRCLGEKNKVVQHHLVVWRSLTDSVVRDAAAAAVQPPPCDRAVLMVDFTGGRSLSGNQSEGRGSLMAAAQAQGAFFF